MKKALYGIIAIATSLALGSCINPIDESVIAQIRDATNPHLVITSPEDGSEYTQTVVVSGSVSDDDGEIRRITYRVTGTVGDLVSGEVLPESIDESGSFSFSFSTVSFTGPIGVTVDSHDWNGNVASIAFTLEYPGSTLSSFAVAPGNKQVSLFWEEIPDAISYTVFYTIDGTVPSEDYGIRIEGIPQAYTSELPLVIEGLRNGDSHVFLLKGYDGQGSAQWVSSLVESIPLSEFTLAPRVEGRYGEIYVEWVPITGADEFIVYRSTSESGPYEVYSGALSTNSFIDTGVEPDTWYFYKVKPNLEGTVISTYDGDRTIEIPLSAEQRVSGIDFAEDPVAVRISGDYAYLLTSQGSLVAVDISVPREYDIVDAVPLADPRDLAILSSVAYVADGSGGLVTVDISSPTNLAILDTFTSTDFASPYSQTDFQEVAVAANGGTVYAFVVLDDSGADQDRIVAINASDPSALTELSGSISYSNYAINDVEAEYDGGFRIFFSLDQQVSPYYFWIYSSTYSGSTFSDYGWYNLKTGGINYIPGEITLRGDYVYFTGDSAVVIEEPYFRLFVFDQDSLGSGVLGQSGDVTGIGVDIVVRSETAYVANAREFVLYDISDPANPAMMYLWDTPGISKGVDTDGTRAFIASGALGFHGLDIAIPDVAVVEPLQAGTAIYGLDIRNDVLYTARSSGVFATYDAQNSASIVPLDSVNMTVASDVDILGHYAFVAAGLQGLAIVDVANPSNLGTPVYAAIEGSTIGIKVQGDYAYAMAGNGVHVFDISDPENPAVAGFMDSISGMRDADFADGWLYMSDSGYFRDSALWVLNVSEPELIFPEDQLYFGYDYQTMNGVSVQDGYAYVADGQFGFALNVIDVNPLSATYGTKVGGYDFVDDLVDIEFTGVDVEVSGEYAYVIHEFGVLDLSIADISDPKSVSTASIIKTMDWGGSSNELALNGGYLFIADSGGLRVVDLFPGF